MRFVAFSDSHDNVNAIKDLMDEIKKEKVDFYLHAGDVISPFALKEFKLDNFYIAFGNNDGDRLTLMKIALEMGWVMADIINVDNIAVYHGTNKEILEILKRKYKVIVTGHTHHANVVKEGEIIIINPGEICGYLTNKRSYIVYEDGDVSIIEF